jgi:hypothetical protein
MWKPLAVYLIVLVGLIFTLNIVTFLSICPVKKKDGTQNKKTNIIIIGIVGAFLMVVISFLAYGAANMVGLSQTIKNSNFVGIPALVNVIIFSILFPIYTKVITKKLKYGNICDGDSKNRVKHAAIFSAMVCGASILSTLIIYGICGGFQKSSYGLDRNGDGRSLKPNLPSGNSSDNSSTNPSTTLSEN